MIKSRSTKWMGHMEWEEREEKYTILVGKPDRKRTFKVLLMVHRNISV
jgi:hypothetical protein